MTPTGYLVLRPTTDGMVSVEGDLDAETGAALTGAVEAAYAEIERVRGPIQPGRDAVREAGRRRADAFELVIRRALAKLERECAKASKTP